MFGVAIALSLFLFLTSDFSETSIRWRMLENCLFYVSFPRNSMSLNKKLLVPGQETWDKCECYLIQEVKFHISILKRFEFHWMTALDIKWWNRYFFVYNYFHKTSVLILLFKGNQENFQILFYIAKGITLLA